MPDQRRRPLKRLQRALSQARNLFVGNALPSTLLAIWLCFAFAPMATAQVEERLAAEQTAIAPGETVRVVLELDPDPNWYTFWANPGIGQATEVEWTLPDGWLADEIDWPVPDRITLEDGTVTGHGFKRTVWLPMRVTAPLDAMPGETIDLKAAISYQMCEETVCIPVDTELDLSLPILEDGGETDFRLSEALSGQPMPEAGDGISVQAAGSAEEITLILSGLPNASGFHFFPLNEMIWHDVAQKFETGDTGLSVTLPVDSYWEGGTDLLSGLIAFTDETGAYRGVLINAPVETGTTSANGSLGPLMAILFAFLGGLILNLMPCVLPVLSLKALSLVKSAGQDAGAARTDGYAYTAGVLATFAAVGAALIAVRAATGFAGWGTMLQEPLVVMGLVLTMALVGFNLIGAFDVGTSVQGVGSRLASRPGLQGSFFTGALAVIVATPCTAPFMAPAVGFALAQPIWLALAIFLAMGLGLALPYLAIAALPATRALLPKPGAWTGVFKQVLAFPMFATAAWLLWVLGGQTGADGMGLGLILVIAAGFAAWAYGKRQRAHKPLSWTVTASASALVVLAGLFGLARVQNLLSPVEFAAPAGFEETAYTPAALDEKLAANAPVFLYFTADWCITCKVNERVALKTESTTEFFAENAIEVMVGDWTNDNPDIAAKLRDYNRAGIPVYLFFAPGAGANDGVLLPQVLTPNILRSAIEEVLAP